METTNIRHIIPAVSDFHVTSSLQPNWRVRPQLDYVKANQRWWIEIRFSSDLDAAIFGRCVRGSPVRLAELKGRFFIEDPAIPDSANVSRAFQYAVDDLPRLNAAVRVLCASYIPATYVAVIELSSDGTGRGIVSTDLRIHGTSEFEAIARFLNDPVCIFPEVRKRALRDGNVRDALFFFGAEGNDWANLYKAVEVVEDCCGGSAGLLCRAWCSKSQLERFTRTANHQEAAGAYSRHARQNVAPPPDPMSIEEARLLVQQILDKWIRFLVMQPE